MPTNSKNSLVEFLINRKKENIAICNKNINIFGQLNNDIGARLIFAEKEKIAGLIIELARLQGLDNSKL